MKHKMIDNTKYKSQLVRVTDANRFTGVTPFPLNLTEKKCVSKTLLRLADYSFKGRR